MARTQLQSLKNALGPSLPVGASFLLGGMSGNHMAQNFPKVSCSNGFISLALCCDLRRWRHVFTRSAGAEIFGSISQNDMFTRTKSIHILMTQRCRSTYINFARCADTSWPHGGELGTTCNYCCFASWWSGSSVLWSGGPKKKTNCNCNRPWFSVGITMATTCLGHGRVKTKQRSKTRPNTPGTQLAIQKHGPPKFQSAVL